jgi:XRE family aerobic/anaerobic benzoate catabolism transcriptional regulator
MAPRPTAAARSRDALLASVGASVRATREERGLSRRTLSERCGVSERFLAELESGAGNISIARLAEVAKALGTSASLLLATAEGASADGSSSAAVPARGPLIALVGMRGAGKSAIGRRVAEQLGVPFFEQDQLVERAAGLSLADIFSLHGEAYYRRLAREVLARFLAETDAGVLATGGGVVTDREAYRLLQKRCVTVWLRAAPEDHWHRVLQQGDTRPGDASADARSELRALLQAREPLYAQASVTVDTSRLGLDGAIKEVARRVARALATGPGTGIG